MKNLRYAAPQGLDIDAARPRCADRERHCAEVIKNSRRRRRRNPSGFARSGGRLINMGRRWGRVTGAVLVLGSGCGTTFGQGQRASPLHDSDLGRDNLSRAAASAIDLKTLLERETGLLVEVKRWVAKDATDHGQIIGDADLTDDAIFEKLNSDSQFRSTVTRIVQGYGYLLPKLNPDSQLARPKD